MLIFYRINNFMILTIFSSLLFFAASIPYPSNILSHEFVLQVALQSSGKLFDSRNTTLQYDNQFFQQSNDQLKYAVRLPSDFDTLNNLQINIKVYAEFKGKQQMIHERVEGLSARKYFAKDNGLQLFFADDNYVMKNRVLKRVIPTIVRIQIENIDEENQKSTQRYTKLPQFPNYYLPLIQINQNQTSFFPNIIPIQESKFNQKHQIQIQFCMRSSIQIALIRLYSNFLQEYEQIMRKGFQVVATPIPQENESDEFDDFEAITDQSHRDKQTANTMQILRDDGQLLQKVITKNGMYSFLANLNLKYLAAIIFIVVVIFISLFGEWIRVILENKGWRNYGKSKYCGSSLARPTFRMTQNALTIFERYLTMNNASSIIASSIYPLGIFLYNRWKFNKIIKSINPFKLQLSQPYKKYGSFDILALTCFWIAVLLISVSSITLYLQTKDSFTYFDFFSHKFLLALVHSTMIIISKYFQLFGTCCQIFIIYNLKSVRHINWTIMAIYLMVAFTNNIPLFYETGIFYYVYYLKEEVAYFTIIFQAYLYRGREPTYAKQTQIEHSHID